LDRAAERTTARTSVQGWRFCKPFWLFNGKEQARLQQQQSIGVEKMDFLAAMKLMRWITKTGPSKKFRPCWTVSNRVGTDALQRPERLGWERLLLGSRSRPVTYRR